MAVQLRTKLLHQERGLCLRGGCYALHHRRYYIISSASSVLTSIRSENVAPLQQEGGPDYEDEQTLKEKENHQKGGLEETEEI